MSLVWCQYFDIFPIQLYFVLQQQNYSFYCSISNLNLLDRHSCIYLYLCCNVTTKYIFFTILAFLFKITLFVPITIHKWEIYLLPKITILHLVFTQTFNLWHVYVFLSLNEKLHVCNSQNCRIYPQNKIMALQKLLLYCVVFFPIP